MLSKYRKVSLTPDNIYLQMRNNEGMLFFGFEQIRIEERGTVKISEVRDGT